MGYTYAFKKNRCNKSSQGIFRGEIKWVSTLALAMGIEFFLVGSFVS